MAKRLRVAGRAKVCLAHDAARDARKIDYRIQHRADLVAERGFVAGVGLDGSDELLRGFLDHFCRRAAIAGVVKKGINAVTATIIKRLNMGIPSTSRIN